MVRGGGIGAIMDGLLISKRGGGGERGIGRDRRQRLHKLNQEARVME